MAKVAVGEGIRAVLQPNDNGVDLADCADQGVVNVIVDSVGGYEKAKGCVDAVCPGDGIPGCLEGAGKLEKIFRRGGVRAFETAEGAFGVLCGAQFDDVGNEEVAWDESIEQSAEEDVFAAIVVAADTEKYAILRTIRVFKR